MSPATQQKQQRRWNKSEWPFVVRRIRSCCLPSHLGPGQVGHLFSSDALRTMILLLFQTCCPVFVLAELTPPPTDVTLPRLPSDQSRTHSFCYLILNPPNPLIEGLIVKSTCSMHSSAQKNLKDQYPSPSKFTL